MENVLGRRNRAAVTRWRRVMGDEGRNASDALQARFFDFLPPRLVYDTAAVGYKMSGCGWHCAALSIDDKAR